MKITLFGRGKMGQLVEKLALAQGHSITSLEEADVAIDFSHASVVMDHLNMCLKAQKPIIIGTTGWNDRLIEAKKKVLESKGSCLYSPNFCIGLFLFEQIVRKAAHLFAPFAEYGVAGVEWHHSQKKDTPSGTSYLLRETLLEEMPRLKDLNFSSVRCGSMPGTYDILFDGPNDTIQLSHTARSRQGYVEGALSAACWIVGRSGFFTLQDLFLKENADEI